MKHNGNIVNEDMLTERRGREPAVPGERPSAHREPEGSGLVQMVRRVARIALSVLCSIVPPPDSHGEHQADRGIQTPKESEEGGIAQPTRPFREHIARFPPKGNCREIRFRVVKGGAATGKEKTTNLEPGTVTILDIAIGKIDGLAIGLKHPGKAVVIFGGGKPPENPPHPWILINDKDGTIVIGSVPKGDGDSPDVSFFWRAEKGAGETELHGFQPRNGGRLVIDGNAKNNPLKRTEGDYTRYWESAEGRQSLRFDGLNVELEGVVP